MEQISPINLFLVRCYHSVGRFAARGVRNASFRNIYALVALLILLASTAYWALLGARVQLFNADQLSDPYLFENWKTFHGATFPSAHTFLIKWPVFWLLHYVGITRTNLLAATVALSVVTVAALAFVLYRINKRPLILGTIYGALAFILLLVPPQSYAGALLPVNMAMLTTRNIEYIVYICSLVLLIRGRRVRSWAFWAGTILLGLLIASDKLFLVFSIGAAALALVAYAVLGNWRMTSFAVRWLLAGAAAALFSAVILSLISALHITHITGGSSVSPYGVGLSPHSILLGAVYALLGIATNFGANPAFSNTLLGKLPHDATEQIMKTSGLPYAIAALLFVFGVVCVWRTLHLSFRRTPATEGAHTPLADQLSMALIASTVVACGVFVATDHYYAVDARYLTIGLFAVVITVAAALRRQWGRPKLLLLGGSVLLLACIPNAFIARSTAMQQTQALSSQNARNDAVAQALRHHTVDTLLGDYWRVLPIRLASGGKLQVSPLGSCTSLSSTLTSSVWQPDLRTHSFAYLITLDGSLTGYPHCSLQQVSHAYGRPNSIQVIAGSLAEPKEALLFYDNGSHPQAVLGHATEQQPATLLPITPDQITKTGCMQRPTVMNFVAHEDDDLLFMNPDILHSLHAGSCIRTVFLTAGDSGNDRFYWLGRQLGSEAAYSTMLGIPNIWDQQVVQVDPSEYITIATPRGSAQVSLVFINLPDGNVHGDGFMDSGNQSLAALYGGKLQTMRAVDGQSAYTHDQLASLLVMLMDIYQPAQINTQGDQPSAQYPDHSDHIATGRFTALAAQQYDDQHFSGVIQIPLKRYIGYPIHGYAANVSGQDLTDKQAAFFAYAQYDGNVCKSVEQCAGVPTYNSYISRQYQQGQ
jgi:LmbE family N-acetylglucosaminyl deacetylase